MAGQMVGEIELSDAIFGIEPNEAFSTRSLRTTSPPAVRAHSPLLPRVRFRYGGRKPYRQKGTGSARAGYAGLSRVRHGGIAFAPKPRDYSYTLNKKVKRLALKSALSSKAAQGEIIVIDGLKMNEIKTAAFKNFLTSVGCDGKSLVITEKVNEKVVKSARNIPGVTTTVATILSTYDILNAKTFIVDKAALEKIEEVYA
ncbi:MAG: 50S ribosomal protein L4 [Oscillospiraceae bacterium]